MDALGYGVMLNTVPAGKPTESPEDFEIEIAVNDMSGNTKDSVRRQSSWIVVKNWLQSLTFQPAEISRIESSLREGVSCKIADGMSQDKVEEIL